MQPLAQQAQPILEESITQAAQSPPIHHDDTTMRILDLRRPGSATALQMDPERKGTFATSILAYVDDHPVALYFTGWQHAGENLAAVLRRRDPDLEPPIQMCDALSRNLSPELESILAHCLGHGPDPHLSAQRGQSLRLPDGDRHPPRSRQPDPEGLAALELPQLTRPQRHRLKNARRPEAA
jgi:hypothetical protein